MTTRSYRQHAEELVELREHFYRTRLMRGERLSLVESQWLFRRDMKRVTLSVGLSMNEAMKAIAEFTKVVRGLREMISGGPKFPRGGMTTNNGDIGHRR